MFLADFKIDFMLNALRIDLAIFFTELRNADLANLRAALPAALIPA